MTWDEAELMFPLCSVEWDVNPRIERKERFVLEVHETTGRGLELWAASVSVSVVGMPTPEWLRGIHTSHWFRERWQWSDAGWTRYWPTKSVQVGTLETASDADPLPDAY